MVTRLAGELPLWTVLGSVHPLTPPHRPHNSLYVISDRGTIATRYDERMLSRTKVNYLYTPGSAPVVFDVDGVRLGCALGMEATSPEVFLEYERLDVDGVLFSTHGPRDTGQQRALRPAGPKPTPPATATGSVTPAPRKTRPTRHPG